MEANSPAWFGWGRDKPPHLRPKKPGTPANIVHRMAPHVLTGASVAAEFYRATLTEVCRLYVSPDAGVTWAKVWDAAEAAPGTGRLAASVTLREQVRGLRDFRVRAECATAGDVKQAGLNSLRIEAVFQHNMFARPFLGPGENRVTVRLANPETLARDRFTVTRVWREGDRERTHTRRITRSPATYTINVGGGEIPRMVRLVLAVDP